MVSRQAVAPNGKPYLWIETKEEYEDQIALIMGELPPERMDLYASLRNQLEKDKANYDLTMNDPKTSQKQRQYIHAKYNASYDSVVNFERDVGIHHLGMSFFRTQAIKKGGQVGKEIL